MLGPRGCHPDLLVPCSLKPYKPVFSIFNRTPIRPGHGSLSRRRAANIRSNAATTLLLGIRDIGPDRGCRLESIPPHCIADAVFVDDRTCARVQRRAIVAAGPISPDSIPQYRGGKGVAGGGQLIGLFR